MVSILFVCMGNTCRSVIAEALTKRRYGEHVIVRSVGLKPGTPEDAANALDTLKNHFDISVPRHTPTGIQDIHFEDFDLLVALDKYVAKKLKDLPHKKLLTWNIDDPYGDDLEEYRRCALKINREVERLPVPVSTKLPI
jgi:protein-tyrosine-phosphatase